MNKSQEKDSVNALILGAGMAGLMGKHLAKFRRFMEGAAEPGSKTAHDVRVALKGISKKILRKSS